MEQKKSQGFVILVIVIATLAAIAAAWFGWQFYNTRVVNKDFSVAGYYYSFVGPFSLPNTLYQGKNYTFSVTCKNDTANTISAAGVQVDAERTSGGTKISYTFVSMSPSGTVTAIPKTGYTAYQVLDGAVAPGASVTYTITMAPPAGVNIGDYFSIGYFCSYGDQGWLTGYSVSLKVQADPNNPPSSSSSASSASSSVSSSSSSSVASSSSSSAASSSSSVSTSKSSSKASSASAASVSSAASSSSSSITSSAETGDAELKFDDGTKAITTVDTTNKVIVTGHSLNVTVPVDIFINDKLVLAQVDLDKDGNFSLELGLVAGNNKIRIEATEGGVTLADTIQINYAAAADNTPIIVLLVTIVLFGLVVVIEEVRFGKIRKMLVNTN